MSIIKMGGLLVPLALMSAACTARPALANEIVLNSDATELAGWFSARGEWTLFPAKSTKRYNPYTNNENAKCVSIINGTGRRRSDFASLGGRYVVIRGRTLAYDDLSDGGSPSDKLLSKKYYENEPVENFCLRRFVFIATDLRQMGK